jgi:hypothetical protein
MKEKRVSRGIQIPKWMNTAITELAKKQKRSVNGEIEFLVESALEHIKPLEKSAVSMEETHD